MTQQSIIELDRAKIELVKDFKAVVTDSEDLLKAAAAVSGEGFAAVRAKFEEKLKSAGESLANASQAAVRSTKQGAAATDDYVHHNPWAAIGVAAAAGVLIGVLTARR